MKKNLSYIDSVHRDGRIWNIGVMLLLIAFPLTVAFLFGAAPDWGALLVGLIATAPMYWAVGVIESITFVPMLGAGGSYLSFVTGNISNLKLPCAINALEQNGVSASSEEGEIISTIAIATSSIVTTIIILIGVICIVPLTPILEAPQPTPFLQKNSLLRKNSNKQVKKSRSKHRNMSNSLEYPNKKCTFAYRVVRRSKSQNISALALSLNRYHKSATPSF